MPRVVSSLLFVLTAFVGVGAQAVSPALAEMADAERAFAKTALAKGIRDAFVEFFADDSVGFYPTPTNAREFYRGLKPTPLTRRLEWEPRTGDIARSGELGWLTGPYVARNTETNDPPRDGCYFSVWKKQADGAWKVLIDVGISTPGPAVFPDDQFVAVGESAGRYEARTSDAAPTRASIVAADQALAERAARDGVVSAYDQVLTADSRLHVEGTQPLVSREKILAWVKEDGGRVAFVPDTGDVARSGDVAFTRGAYTIEASSSPEPRERGYYVRTWKRVRDGRWTLALEVRNATPQ